MKQFCDVDFSTPAVMLVLLSFRVLETWFQAFMAMESKIIRLRELLQRQFSRSASCVWVEGRWRNEIRGFFFSFPLLRLCNPGWLQMLSLQARTLKPNFISLFYFIYFFLLGTKLRTLGMLGNAVPLRWNPSPSQQVPVVKWKTQRHREGKKLNQGHHRL